MGLPLRGEVTQAVAADLNRSGFGKCCAGCGKPFNAARKQRAVGRVSHIDPAGKLFTTAWLFCGPCAAGIRRNGNLMPAALMEEARAATSAGLLMAAPAKGSA
jgi:hypothetical protein